jgi:hypothetical protein
MAHFLRIEEHRLSETTEGRTFENIVAAAISLKSGDTFRAFPGFKNILASHLGEIKDLSNLVTDYLSGLEIELSPLEMIDQRRNFDPEVFNIEGCDFVCIQWFSGVKITLPYSTLSLFLLRLRSLLLSELGRALFSGMYHDKLAISFHGNISVVKIRSCYFLTRVVNFPDLALVREVGFPNCSNLESVPPALPRTVKSLCACFREIRHTIHGYERWNTEGVIDFSHMFMENKGAKFPRFAFDSAISICQMFDGANNIHFSEPELFLNLPKCIDASKAFYGTTNLGGKIVIHAPALKLIDEMFGSQSKQKGHIVLVASPELSDKDAGCFFSNNLDLKYAFELKQAGMKPIKRDLVMPLIISKELPDMCLPDIFKTLTEPTFLRQCYKDGVPVPPKPLVSTVERKPNRFGRMKNYVLTPNPFEVFRREFQPGAVVSMKIWRNPHTSCKLTKDDAGSFASQSIINFFEGYLNEICWLYNMDYDQLFDHLFSLEH